MFWLKRRNRVGFVELNCNPDRIEYKNKQGKFETAGEWLEGVDEANSDRDRFRNHADLWQGDERTDHW